MSFLQWLLFLLVYALWILLSLPFVAQLFTKGGAFPPESYVPALIYYLFIVIAWEIFPLVLLKKQLRRFFFVLAVCLPPWSILGVQLGFIISFAILISCLFSMNTLAFLLWRPSQHPFRNAFTLLSLIMIGAALSPNLVLHFFPAAELKYTVFSRLVLFQISLVYSLLMLPLSWVILCRLKASTDAKRHLRFGIYLFILIGTLLLSALPFTFRRLPNREIPAEELNVIADKYEDKHPSVFNEDRFWLEVKAEEGTDTSIRCFINKSPAILNLSVPAYYSMESKAEEKLYPSFAEAMEAAEGALPVLPSLQMLQYKSKSFDDRLIAALEQHIFLHSPALGGGLTELLKRFISTLHATESTSPERDAAMARLSAALRLTSIEVASSRPETEALTQQYLKFFLKSPLAKPIGFYGESPVLEEVFQVGRFLQDPLPTPVAIELAKALQSDSTLAAHYERLIKLNSALHNPDATFAVADLPPLRASYSETALLEKALYKTEKGIELLQRYPKNLSIEIAVLPSSSSRESELFERLYAGSSMLPWENVMNRFIKTVRSGDLSLCPNDNSGWYDYQSYALETLLLPERAQEVEKLCLKASYKKHLLQSFKTAITQQRESHIRAMPPVKCLGDHIDDLSPPPPPEFIIQPDLCLEPNATYMLRTARAYRFLLTTLRALLPADELDSIFLEAKKPLPLAMEEIMSLFYGFYLQVCDDIGMKPLLEEDELSAEQREANRNRAKTWLAQCHEDPVFQEDTRIAVPVLNAPLQGKARYWLNVGVTVKKFQVYYGIWPAIRYLDAQSEAILFEDDINNLDGDNLEDRRAFEKSHKISCQGRVLYYFIPVQVFAEADGPITPPTRSEFRTLCDTHKNQKAIINAMPHMDHMSWKKAGIGFLALLLGVGLLVLVYRRLSRR